MRVLILVMVVVFMIGIPKPVAASEDQCRAVLHDCDTALQKEQTVNALDQQIISDQNKRFADQTSELHTEEVWKPIALGAVTAAIIEGIILALKH